MATKKDNSSYQRKFKEKMYNAGFQQKIVWVKKDQERKRFGLSKEVFFLKLEKLLFGFSKPEQGKLFNLVIKIIEGKKEVRKLKARKENKK